MNKQRFQGNFYRFRGLNTLPDDDLTFHPAFLASGRKQALPGILLFAITAAGTARRVDLNTIDTLQTAHQRTAASTFASDFL
ncbi:MAG: hypothetical protein ACLRXB_06360 [Escherichia coli]|uniref:Uncharacterized protein n=1 Tax=Escherichia coli TaxID=562 RepID=A0A376UG48_ECOLX|nr:Uncharacterised protein [Escherichia coli]